MLDFITINEHSSIRVDEGKIIYSDPYNINCAPHDADIILITHSHFDHYRKKYVVHCLSERRCVQTYRRSEARLFSAKINIQPVAGLRKYRQLCFGAFFNKFMGKGFLPVEP